MFWQMGHDDLRGSEGQRTGIGAVKGCGKGSERARKGSEAAVKGHLRAVRGQGKAVKGGERARKGQ